MPATKALALIEPILSALSAAHAAGLIHRDIKPENVLIADDGRVKVADFGLAKAVSADTQHTATGGVLIGTVSYLAPELVVDGRADARADVYAAGVVLYELLTGRKPHEGASPIQVAYKHVHEDVPPPSAVVPGLPAYVDALVARATARDRSHRPADARVLLHQVHRVKQALDEGVPDDPELVADLAPPLAVVVLEPELEDLDDRPRRRAGARRGRAAHDVEQDREHTDPLEGSDRYHDTTTIDRHEPSAGARDPDPASPAGRLRPVGARRGRPRRSRRGLVLLLVALLLAVGGGAARGTSASPATPAPPASSGSPPRRPRSGWTRPGSASGSRTRRTPRPSPRARSSAPTPRPASGCSTTAPSPRWCRSAWRGTRCRSSAATPRTRPRRAIQDLQPRVRQLGADVPPDHPRGPGHRQQPQGRHPAQAGRHRRHPAQPRAAADQGRRLDRQGRRQGGGGADQAGPRGDPHRGLQRHGRRGRRHPADAEHRQPLQGRQGRAHRLRGPRAGRDPAGRRDGRRAPPRTSSATPASR